MAISQWEFIFLLSHLISSLTNVYNERKLHVVWIMENQTIHSTKFFLFFFFLFSLVWWVGQFENYEITQCKVFNIYNRYVLSSNRIRQQRLKANVKKFNWHVTAQASDNRQCFLWLILGFCDSLKRKSLNMAKMMVEKKAKANVVFVSALFLRQCVPTLNLLFI